MHSISLAFYIFIHQHLVSPVTMQHDTSQHCPALLVLQSTSPKGRVERGKYELPALPSPFEPQQRQSISVGGLTSLPGTKPVKLRLLLFVLLLLESPEPVAWWAALFGSVGFCISMEKSMELCEL